LSCAISSRCCSEQAHGVHASARVSGCSGCSCRAGGQSAYPAHVAAGAADAQGSVARSAHLIVRMSHENFLWGAPRIHGELQKLGFDVSQATVSRYMPRRGYPPTPTWRTFLRNQAFRIGTIGLGEAGRLSDKLLAVVRGWIARVVRCVTKVRDGFRCGLIELSLTLHRLRPYRSSNRTARRDPRSGCVPVRCPPTRSRPRRQLDYGPVDGFRRIARGHHRRASCRHSRILHDQPRSRAQAAHNSYNAIVLHVCHEQLAQKANDPQCPSPTRAPFPRVTSRGQGYEELQLC